MRYMAANAWVGGGAPAFAQALAARRASLQLAFQSAAEQIAQRIGQLSGQARVPAFSTSVSVAAARPSSFSGMDVTAMGRLVADLQRAGQELPQAGQRLAAELSALCISSPSARQVGDAGVWAEEQVRDLRQRLAVIQQTHDISTASQATAAFGLFGGHAPDANGVGKLTVAAAGGDVAALKALVDLQRTGKDTTLAGRLSVWWRQLGPLAQGQLMAASPSLVGSLNGLPAVDRDRANRAYLAGQKTAITAELERLRASSTGMKEALKKLVGQESPTRDPRQKYDIPAQRAQLIQSIGKIAGAIEGLELKMRQITAVEQGLARGGQNGRPPALLLQLELGGPGKTAVSFGNPDEADNVAVYVPGTDTKLEGFGGDDSKRAAVTWDQANFFQPNKKIASIAWIGYDAPQWSAFLSLDRTPALSPAASKGAPLLASFTDGLHAAHKPVSDVRLTVLGHSYGSTTVGKAAQLRPHSFADQLIFVGSPGGGASQVNDLGVNLVWVGEAPNDLVGDLGAVAPLGGDPSKTNFGAPQFYVADSGDFVGTLAAHSKYWDDDSASLKNIGHLIDGQYDRLIPFPGPSRTSGVTPPPPIAPPTSPPSMSHAMPPEKPSPHPLPSPAPVGE